VASARGSGSGQSGGGTPPRSRPGGGSDGGAPEVIALLRSHGVPATAAPPIVRAGETLRQRTEREGIEVAALLALETGRLIGPPVLGTEDLVDLTDQMGALQPGRRYVQLHTHPASSSFSYRDLWILLKHPELRTMVVVGQDRSWYLLSKRRGQPTVDPNEGVALWRLRYTEVSEHSDPLIARGTLTEAEALRREVHETMERLAPDIGLRYDHLEPLR
jgi:hypothetical protein